MADNLLHHPLHHRGCWILVEWYGEGSDRTVGVVHHQPQREGNSITAQQHLNLKLAPTLDGRVCYDARTQAWEVRPLTGLDALTVQTPAEGVGLLHMACHYEREGTLG